jgi:hypothetical protein
MATQIQSYCIFWFNQPQLEIFDKKNLSVLNMGIFLITDPKKYSMIAIYIALTSLDIRYLETI